MLNRSDGFFRSQCRSARWQEQFNLVPHYDAPRFLFMWSLFRFPPLITLDYLMWKCKAYGITVMKSKPGRGQTPCQTSARMPYLFKSQLCFLVRFRCFRVMISFLIHHQISLCWLIQARAPDDPRLMYLGYRFSKMRTGGGGCVCVKNPKCKSS